MRVLNTHTHVYKHTHAHWSTTTGPYHYGSAQDTIYPTGSGVYVLLLSACRKLLIDGLHTKATNT